MIAVAEKYFKTRSKEKNWKRYKRVKQKNDITVPEIFMVGENLPNLSFLWHEENKNENLLKPRERHTKCLISNPLGHSGIINNWYLLNVSRQQRGSIKKLIFFRTSKFVKFVRNIITNKCNIVDRRKAFISALLKILPLLKSVLLSIGEKGKRLSCTYMCW